MRNGIKVIDIHNHFYSKPWLDYLSKRTAAPQFEWTGPNSGVAKIGTSTVSHVDKAGDFDVEARIADLDAAGIDVQMYSSIDGKIVTAPEFYPIFEKAAAYRLPVKIHPSFRPLTTEVMQKAGLPLQLFGFTLDTTMALTLMLLQGYFEKLPDLKVIHSHLGGMAPYMMGRIDTAFKRYAQEICVECSLPPSEAYRMQVYIDTLSMHVPAIKCAYEYMGIDHLLFGTDYPHRASGTVEDNIAILDKVGFSDEEKAKVFSKNAMKLFDLK